MTTLGEIVRQYGAAYRAQFGERLLPSQHAAMLSIEQCRTEALGGTSMAVRPAPRCATATIPAATVTARPANTTPRRAGSLASRSCCCPCPTSWSPSRYQRNCVMSSIVTSAPCPPCCFVPRPPH
jgi:hypothetical protein